MRTDEVGYELGGAQLISERIDEICFVYDEVFSKPPFHWRQDESELHRQRLVKLIEDDSFGVALASAGKRLIGFGYGFTIPAATKRWGDLKPKPDATLAAEWPGRTFMLFDYAVSEEQRGRGVGKKLHHSLLSTRFEERATLTVQPTALDTKRIYEHWGWRKVGEFEGGPMAAAPVFDAYILDSLDEFRLTRQSS